MTSIASSFDKLYPLLGARLRALVFWSASSLLRFGLSAYLNLLSQNLCSGVGYRHRVLEMSTHASIVRDRRPAIAQHAHVRLSRVHHGFDRDHHPGPQLHAGTGFAEIRHLRIFVHVAADPMSNKIPNHRKPFGFHNLLYRGPDIAERRPWLHHRDARMERLLRHFEQPRRIGRDLLAHRHGDGRIAEKTIHNGSAIHRNDVPFFEDPLLRWNAVHNLVVDRGAKHTRKSVIALEGRLRAKLLDSRLGHPFEIESGSARLYLAAHQFQHLADNLARAAHFFDLQRRLQYNGHEQFSVLSYQFSVFQVVGTAPAELTTEDRSLTTAFTVPVISSQFFRSSAPHPRN